LGGSFLGDNEDDSVTDCLAVFSFVALLGGSFLGDDEDNAVADCLAVIFL